MSGREHGGRSDANVALMIAELGGLVAGAMIGGAFAPAVMNKNHARRQAFRKDLAAALSHYGVDLISAALGRDRDNRFIWHVTVQAVNSVSLHRIPFNPDIDPYARSTLAQLAASTLKLLAEGAVSSELVAGVPKAAYKEDRLFCPNCGEALSKPQAPGSAGDSS